jgi:hypothetical protein
MPGIPRELDEHELKIFPNTKPIKQFVRRYSGPKSKRMGEEINRLLEAKFITELKEATWLPPFLMGEKKESKIYHICIDFTALNKHCSKDYFLLPRIDQIIDSTIGCERLSFLDAYYGYRQIRLKVKDEENIMFITPHGVYCYTMMPFGLKNAGATYQRCMQACLKNQINRNIEVYVDEIVIKTNKADSLLDDLWHTHRTAPMVPHLGTRNRSQPREDSRNCQYGATTEAQTCLAAGWKTRSTQPLHRQA